MHEKIVKFFLQDTALTQCWPAYFFLKLRLKCSDNYNERVKVQRSLSDTNCTFWWHQKQCSSLQMYRELELGVTQRYTERRNGLTYPTGCKSVCGVCFRVWHSCIGSRPSDHYSRSVCWFVCLSVCLLVCKEFFSAVFDPISIKLGHMLYVWV